MSSYAWAQLPAGEYGLPGPAVVMSPWVLEVRVPRPRRRGFTRVTHPGQWPRVGAARKMIADYRDPGEVLVVSAERPGEIDADGLRNLVPGSAAAGDAHWVIGSPFGGLTAQAFHDHVHRAGRLLLLTGDPSAYWSAARSDDAVSFDGLFPGGTWAAWVPLLVHAYDYGVVSPAPGGPARAVVRTGVSPVPRAI